MRQGCDTSAFSASSMVTRTVIGRGEVLPLRVATKCIRTCSTKSSANVCSPANAKMTSEEVRSYSLVTNNFQRVSDAILKRCLSLRCVPFISLLLCMDNPEMGAFRRYTRSVKLFGTCSSFVIIHFNNNMDGCLKLGQSKMFISI